MVRKKKGDEVPETNAAGSAQNPPQDAPVEQDGEIAGPSRSVCTTRRAQQLALLEDSGLVSSFCYNIGAHLDFLCKS